MGNLVTFSLEDTRALGARVARSLVSGMVVALNGDVGSGKTELVRGIAAALGSVDCVKSPSFSIVNTYRTPKITLHHFDFYRLKKSNELFEIGYDDYLADLEGVLLIEWADMFPEMLPASNCYAIHFTAADKDTRHLVVDDALLA